MCIKPHDKYKWNRLRRFIKWDVMKLIYHYNCGTPVDRKIRFLVPEKMHAQALSLVKSNELCFEELSRALVEQHMDRLSKLNEISNYFKDRSREEKEQCNDIKSLKKEMDEKLDKIDLKLEKILQGLGNRY